MFEGYARLAFISPDGITHPPGDFVAMPEDTPEQVAEVKRLMGMGVIQRTDPAGNVGLDGEPEELEDTAFSPAAGAAMLRARRPTGRAAAKLAEKEQRAKR